MLIAENLSHFYNYSLFEGVNFELKQNESVAIVGVSGSGKSTLLHIFSGLLKPHQGQVKLFDNSHDFYSLSEKEQNLIRRNKIGIVFQSHYLFKGFSAKENLEVSSLILDSDFNSQENREIFESLGISDLLEQKVTQLSGGQQQRISIARVLLKQPEIIFADEPTGNLDKNTADEVISTLLNYTKSENHKRGMILVTHDRELAQKCDRVFELKNQEFKQIK
jgi:putative ABC transport system ATP-binding protein